MSGQPTPEWVAAHSNEFTGQTLFKVVCGCGREGQTDLFDVSGYGQFAWDDDDLEGWDISIFDQGHVLVRCPDCVAAGSH